MLPDARGYRIDNGAENYRRFLRGDEEGIAEIVRAYKDGLIFYLNGYVNDISLRFMPYRKRLPETLLLETNIRGKREKGQKPQRNGDFRKKIAVSLVRMFITNLKSILKIRLKTHIFPRTFADLLPLCYDYNTKH